MSEHKPSAVIVALPGAGPSPRGSLRRTIPGIFMRAFKRLLTWQARAAERRHLCELDQRMLRDIGITRAEAEREAAKPFWRP